MGAWNIIREELPKFFQEDQAEGLRNVASAVIPQDLTDVGLMLATGPGGKAIRLGGLALATSTYSPEAEAGVLGKLKALYNQPRALRRLLRGDSLAAITAPPAQLRRVENGSDDFFKQMQDASKAQDAHYFRLKSKHPDNTPQPADILTVLNEAANAGHPIYEIMEPARGWTTINPETGYVGGLLSEGSGPSLVNSTFNALAREHKGPLEATAATDELVNYYRSKGLSVNPDTWKMKFAEGGLVQMQKHCSCNHYAGGGIIGSHTDLYRARSQPGASQERLAPQEHRAFAREWTRENPLLAVPALLAAIPTYTAAKAMGLIRARSPASVEEMAEGYRGMGEGLRSLFGQTDE